ncbi:MAG: preprotein translocase subunit SecY [Nanoarchaeota archaeon]|nr:preprotein translocase subunit SecY [Nanoarchaeota archaeon]|tara:strand:+ start:12030 stop:13418 length:1389 start_codon:yes stop_codon:yes gene_type:complete
MGFIEKLTQFIPEVKGPKQKRLSFKEKLKWTLIILVIFFVMGLIPLFGLGQNSLQQFEFLSIILGASFGSILSLGIGPLVTASIVLQLLQGTGILNFELTTPEGRKKFQGLQKLLGIFFVIFESAIYVLMGGLAPAADLVGTPLFAQLQFLLIFQLFLGGMLILFMDEVISKWGFGSGISLFIAAGVSQQVFIRAFNFLPSPTNPDIAAGAIPALFQSLAIGDVTTAGLQIAAVLATIVVFVMCVYGQAMKVEIPLSFGRVRGYGMRWPLNFFYTSNIPVILVAALLANIQLFARLLENWGLPLLGTFSGNTPVSGIVAWVFPPNLLQNIIRGSLTSQQLIQSGIYTLLMMVGAVIFSIFWMQTAGMDAKSQAKQIMSSGLQIPGFRRDERVLEKILSRYIWPLTIVGGAAVGLLAAIADLSGALSNGTGILLAVMIIYKLYEEIAKQHMMDMHPMMRKFME